MLSFRKTNESILRKLTDRRKDGGTPFYKTLPAEAGGPICCGTPNKKDDKIEFEDGQTYKAGTF